MRTRDLGDDRLDMKVMRRLTTISYLCILVSTLTITFGAMCVDANPVAPGTSSYNFEIIYWILVIAINFVIDLVAFLIGNRIFTKIALTSKMLILTTVAIASLGVLIDIGLTNIFSGPEMADFILGFIVAFTILGIVDYFIAHYVAKFPKGTKLVSLAGFMGVVTNPYLYIIIIKLYS